MNSSSTSKHAVLAPSAASRWMKCPNSALLEAEYPDVESPFAEEGTKAHALAEKLLLCYRAGKPYPELPDGFEAVIDYVDYVADIYEADPLCEMQLEVKLDLSHVAPGCFGTADCIIKSGYVLHVIDLKFGRGVLVEAYGNYQLMLYALGALELYSDVTLVKIHIVQPRRNQFSSWQVTPLNIKMFGFLASRKAQQALSGDGFYQGGPHCRFCKAAGGCRVQAYDILKELEALNYGF